MSVVVSHSEVDAFVSCERKHFYAHMDSGTGLERKQISDALSRGILGHAAMETFFKSRQAGASWDLALKSMNYFLQSEAAKPGCNFNILADVTRLANGWLEFFRDRVESWRVLYVEHEFWLNVTSTIRYPFKPDLVVEEDGRIRVIDYKFQFNFFTTDELALFPQLVKYIGALRALDIFAKHGEYAEFRYRQMSDMSGPKIYRLSGIPLNNERMKRTWNEQIEVTQRIAERKLLPLEVADAKAVRTANKGTCNNCSFKSLCVAQLQGSDGKLIRQTEYTANTYGYSAEDNE